MFDWLSLDPANIVYNVFTSLFAPLRESLRDLISGITSELMFSATMLDYGNPALAKLWQFMTGLSAALALVLALLGIVRAAVAGSAAQLTRVVPGIVFAVVGPQFVFALAPVLALLVREVSIAVVGTTTGDLSAALLGMVGETESGGPGSAFAPLGLLGISVLILLFAGVVMITVVLFVAMSVQALLLVTAPLAFAGLASTMTAGWFRRWLGLFLAATVAPLPVALCLAVGFVLLSTAPDAASAGGEAPLITAARLTASGGFLLGTAFLAPLSTLGLFKFLPDMKSGFAGDPGARELWNRARKVTSLGGKAAAGAAGAAAGGPVGATVGASTAGAVLGSGTPPRRVVNES